MGPRVYRASELNELIPDLERTFADLDRIRDRLRIIKRKMDVLEMIEGPTILETPGPDRAEYQQCLEEIERARKDFESTANRITALGGTIKGVEQGLVDFYGVVDGYLVWLCWKRGEKEVASFHNLDEGFGARQDLPPAYRKP